MKRIVALISFSAIAFMPLSARSEVNEVRIPLGAGGFGFLPLHIMKKHELIEKKAAAAGLKVTVNWAKLGGPSAMNDALLSGSADFISAGPPSFLILWDRTRSNVRVKAVAAMSAMPMYLNTRDNNLRALDDIKDSDKIAVTSVKVSIPSIIMQMYAKEKYGAAEVFRFDRFTVSMAHPDGVIAMLSGNSQIKAHYTSPPFHHRERKDPAIRTIMTTNDVMGGSTTFTMISTTTQFHDENPKVYAAFVAALKQSFEIIRTDKRATAQVLLDSMGGRGWTIDELVQILDDPDIRYSITPENVMKYAAFMSDIGSLKRRPTSLDELFFDTTNIGGGN